MHTIYYFDKEMNTVIKEIDTFAHSKIKCYPNKTELTTDYLNIKEIKTLKIK